MSRLALISTKKSSSLPYFPSYRWVTVKASDLTDGDLAAIQKRLHKLFVAHQPSLMISLGDVSLWLQKGVGAMPYSFARLWRHFENGSSLAEPALTAAFLGSPHLRGHANLRAGLGFSAPIRVFYPRRTTSGNGFSGTIQKAINSWHSVTFKDQSLKSCEVC
jgi:hypothetical protein